MKIKTEFIAPAVPGSMFDWTAWIDGEEEDGPSGYGVTEDAAIQDLRDQLDDI